MRPVTSSAMMWAYAQSAKFKLNLGQGAVLVALASFSNRYTGRTHPKIATLAQEARITPRSASRIIGQLVKIGVLAVRVSKHRGQANDYTLIGYLPEQRPPVDDLFAPRSPDSVPCSQDSVSPLSPTQSPPNTIRRTPQENRGASDVKRGAATSPPPAASAPLRSVDRQPARATAKGRAGEWVAMWNAVCEQSKLTAVIGTLTKGMAIRLETAAAHRALNRDIEAWKRYCLWLSNHAFFGGRSPGRHGAGLAQALQADNIDAWAAATAPQGPIVKIPPTPVRPDLPPPAIPTQAIFSDDEQRLMRQRLAEALGYDDLEFDQPGAKNGTAFYGAPRGRSVDVGSDPPAVWGGDD
jgi:DNA-binding MarR family transcriptional regulator